MKPNRSEAGTTLIELLVAVAIMGIAFVTIIGGMGMAIIGAGTQERKATTSVVLRTAAETITYQACKTVDTYDSTSLPVPPPGFAVSVTRVSQWVDDDTNPFPASTSPCTDTGLQLIELTVTSTSTGQPATEKLQVVKRKP